MYRVTQESDPTHSVIGNKLEADGYAPKILFYQSKTTFSLFFAIFFGPVNFPN